jgi:hypothetical protein
MDDSDLAGSVLAALPVAGVSVATMGDLLRTETVSATDPIAARLDELQFDLGEGPCWDAIAERRPVLEGSLRSSPSRSWPAFSRALLEHDDVHALYAFPLLLGPLALGAMDLWSDRPGDLSDDSSRRASALADEVSRHLLRRAVRDVAEGQAEEARVDKWSRRRIHQATGMVLAQADVSVEDAELLLQGHAFARSVPMSEIADAVLEGRLSFAAGPGGIEEQERGEGL